MKFRIAHISPPGSKNNCSYKNYIYEKKEHDNMIWDDSEENTLTMGDFMIFYCWGTKVEIYKIINISDDYTKRREHWGYKKRNVVYLSPLLNTYSFKDFAKFDPPYSQYKKGCRNNKSYELQKWSKLEKELKNNPNYIISIEKKEMMTGTSEPHVGLVETSHEHCGVDDDFDAEERKALQIIEEIRKKRARRDASMRIDELRNKRKNELRNEKDMFLQKITELQGEIERIDAEYNATNDGKNDHLLIEMELHLQMP